MIVPKLNAACIAIRAVKSHMTCETLKEVYYSYFHSVMSYG
jgi:hypothetical protein